MASSDVEIVVNERVEGDAIEKVASASKDAAKNAKELIKRGPFFHIGTSRRDLVH
ncbi:MAG: hypothetical protein ACI4QF_08775 [Kiritimatiellia bacterium]